MLFFFTQIMTATVEALFFLSEFCVLNYQDDFGFSEEHSLYQT